METRPDQRSRAEEHRFDAWATPRNRTLTLAFLVLGVVCATAAWFVGISDHPPGIALAYVGATAFVLAVAHPWRTARQFGRLLVTSLVGFVVFVVVHNACEAVAARAADAGMIATVLEALGVVTFLLALWLCVPGVLVGAVGAVAVILRERRRPPPRNERAA